MDGGNAGFGQRDHIAADDLAPAIRGHDEHATFPYRDSIGAPCGTSLCNKGI